MNKRVMSAIAAFAVALGTGWTASAQKPITGRFVLTIESTPELQLKKAMRIAATAHDGTKEERLQRFAEAAANLGAVRYAWPNDTGAVLESAIIQAELALGLGQTDNAIAVLEPYVYLAERSGDIAVVHSMLIDAYGNKGDTRNIERHIKDGDHALRTTKVPTTDAYKFLNSAANYYMTHRMPREAVKRYRQMADLPGEQPEFAALSKLSSLKAACMIAEDPRHDTARQEAKELDDLIFKARSNNRSAAEAAIIENVARDAAKIRVRYGL